MACRKRFVLIVDDDADTREVFFEEASDQVRMLGAATWIEICAFTCPHELFCALDLPQQKKGVGQPIAEIDSLREASGLLTIDGNMPCRHQEQIHGIDAIRIIRAQKNLSRFLIFLISGTLDHEIREEAGRLRAGAIQKPACLEISKIFHDAFNHWQQEDAAAQKEAR